MAPTSLPSPGPFTNAYQLRLDAAKAISAVQIASNNTTGGKVAQATKLAAFFTACAAALTAYKP